MVGGRRSTCPPFPGTESRFRTGGKETMTLNRTDDDDDNAALFSEKVTGPRDVFESLI